MKRISAWFDRHPKTRIAFQLVLDGLPFLCTFVVILILYGVLDEVYHYPAVKAIGIMCAGGFLYACLPLFILACWSRHRANVDFEIYPVFKLLSLILRVLSFFAVTWSLGFWFIALIA